MHDINRTQLETGWETGLAGESAFENSESAYENFEYEDESLESEMYPETYGETYETYESSYGEEEGALTEAQEMELAAELLEVSNEQELDRFLGKLIKKAASIALPPGVGGALFNLAKRYAKKVLPVVATAVGGPLGGQLTSLGTQVFGLELEGLSAEDQEFEIARNFTRLVGEAAQEATVVPPTSSPQATAQQAFRTSAEKNAPGLVPGRGQAPMAGQQMPMNMPYLSGRGNRVRVVRIHPRQKFLKLLIVRG